MTARTMSLRIAFASLSAVALLAVVSPRASAAGDDTAAREAAAVAAAERWLELVDHGRYGESWEAAAPFFKNAVPRDQWVSKVGAVRSPFGAVGKRELKSKKHTTTLPGAPDGEYVVLQYATSFAGKQSAVETITPMVDLDGQWRVAGYFVR